MSSRALQIVTQLSNAPEQTMTSQELAERIGVSAHTIKNEMPQVAQILNENGARLVSRRHKGYYVEVLDPEAYDTFSAVTSIRQMPGSMLNADRESRVRYLSRRIISTETGIKKEQLADQLFLSASALMVCVGGAPGVRRPACARALACGSSHAPAPECGWKEKSTSAGWH